MESFHGGDARAHDRENVRGSDHDPIRGRDYVRVHANARDHVRICGRVNDRARVVRCVSCFGEFGYKYTESSCVGGTKFRQNQVAVPIVIGRRRGLQSRTCRMLFIVSDRFAVGYPKFFRWRDLSVCSLFCRLFRPFIIFFPYRYSFALLC